MTTASAPTVDPVQSYLSGYSVAVVSHEGPQPDLMDIPEDFTVLKVIEKGLDRDSADSLAIAVSEASMETSQRGRWGVSLPPGCAA